jgi:hypothetical protein
MDKCNKCQTILILNENILQSRLTKKDYICNACKKERDRINYLKEKNHRLQKAKEYYKNNKEKVKENVTTYHFKNRTKILKKWKKQRLAGKKDKECLVCLNVISKKEKGDKIYCSPTCYNKGHKYRPTQAASKKRRYHTNPMNCLKERCRNRTSAYFKWQGRTKNKTTKELLGCEWEILKTHIESQFKDGMSWTNKEEWHIDHIIPLASAKTKQEILKLCHYSNLQPLLALDNLKKGSKINL